MPLTRPDESASLQALLDDATSAETVTYLVFFSAKDPQTGQPWCPDCQAALPLIEEVFKQDGSLDALLLEVTKQEWKDRTNLHEFRTRCDVQSVPTIVKWQNVSGLFGTAVASTSGGKCSSL